MKKSTFVVAGLISTFTLAIASTTFAQQSAVNRPPSKTFAEHFGQKDVAESPKAGAKTTPNQ